ncbi:MAG: hypothetical protein JNJ54_19430 [Myxococcaceae bacterium]|nr:hypothetical protein [Myxococcaceae bacterium]
MRRSALAFAVLAASCAYRVVAPASELPGGLTSVHVPVFINQTSEAGAEAFFTQALRETYLRAGRLGGADAPGRVEGALVAVSSFPLVASPGRLPNYRFQATVKLTVVRDGAALNTVQVSGGEDYPAGADVLSSETNRGAALRRLAESLMREGAERLATGW